MPEFIHRFVPAQARENGLTLILLHGTGGDENDLLDVGALLAPGAALLSPRGRVLERGFPRFFRRFAEGVFDEDDVKLRANELAAFIAESAARYKFDPAHTVAVGYSNGANIAAAVLLLRPEAFTAAILFRPMVPLTLTELPDLKRKPVFISAGETDRIVPKTETNRLVAMLETAAARVTLNWSPGGHLLEGEEIAAARRWLASTEERTLRAP